jgi:DnaJ-class molecular chaperone
MWRIFTYYIIGVVLWRFWRQYGNLQVLHSYPSRQNKLTLEQARQQLQVNADASWAEIRQAYQNLLRQYHPDKIADMAPELQQLATLRTQQLNAAYHLLRQHVQQRTTTRH